VALAGSVLTKGSSRSDLDIIIYPHVKREHDYETLAAALRQQNMTQLHDRNVVTAAWRRKGSFDDKHVEVWEFQGKRVDVFFLS
jgi:hypothetical protein